MLGRFSHIALKNCPQKQELLELPQIELFINKFHLVKPPQPATDDGYSFTLQYANSDIARSRGSDDEQTPVDVESYFFKDTTPQPSTDDEFLFDIRKLFEDYGTAYDGIAQSRNNSAGFFDLPPEIRIRICEFVIGSPRIATYLDSFPCADVKTTLHQLDTVRSKKQVEKSDYSALISVCKTFFHEVRPVGFNRNMFVSHANMYDGGCSNYDPSIYTNPDVLPAPYRLFAAPFRLLEM